MISNDDKSDLGGAVSGIKKDDIPLVVADVVDEHTDDVELRIRPERAGYGYTVEWTIVEYDPEEREGQPRRERETEPATTDESVWERARQVLSRITAICTDGMPTFDVDREPINFFPVDDQYLFKHYFEQDDLYGQLRRYYNEEAYRFEVPQDAFSEVEDLLNGTYFEPNVIDDMERFCVVYPKYSDHPDVLFKASVLQQSQRDHHVFLMKDQVSVEQAIEQGATRIADSDLEVGF